MGTPVFPNNSYGTSITKAKGALCISRFQFVNLFSDSWMNLFNAVWCVVFPNVCRQRRLRSMLAESCSNWGWNDRALHPTTLSPNAWNAHAANKWTGSDLLLLTDAAMWRPSCMLIILTRREQMSTDDSKDNTNCAACSRSGLRHPRQFHVRIELVGKHWSNETSSEMFFLIERSTNSTSRQSWLFWASISAFASYRSISTSGSSCSAW